MYAACSALKENLFANTSKLNDSSGFSVIDVAINEQIFFAQGRSLGRGTVVGQVGNACTPIPLAERFLEIHRKQHSPRAAPKRTKGDNKFQLFHGKPEYTVVAVDSDSAQNILRRFVFDSTFSSPLLFFRGQKPLISRSMVIGQP